MKARRKPFVWIVFACLAALGFASYVRFGVLPGDLKARVIERVEALTGKRVVFEKTLWLPFEGLSFYDVKVADDAGTVLFSARRLRLDVKLLPFLREKKIVVSNAVLDEPYFDLTLAPPGRKDAARFTKLSGAVEVPVVEDAPRLESLGSGPEALLPENVYLEQVEISNGRVILRPHGSKAVAEEIRDVNLRAAFSRPPVIAIEGSLKLGRAPHAAMSVNGTWNLDSGAYDFFFRVKSTGVPQWLAVWQAKHLVRIVDGRSSLGLRVASLGGEAAAFKAEADLTDARLVIDQGDYSGQMTAVAEGTFDFIERRFAAYEGTLDFVDVRILGLSKSIPELDEVSGTIAFRRDRLDIRAIRGKHRGLTFEALGTLESFKNPQFSGEVRTDADLAQLLPLVPRDQRALLERYRVTGQCRTVTALKGGLKDPAGLKSYPRLQVSGGSVKDPAGKWEAVDVSAEVAADESGLAVQNGRFTLGGKAYEIALGLPKAVGGKGSLTLHSESLAATALFTKLEGAFGVERGRLSVNGLDASFAGTVDDGGLFRLKGDATVDLVKARPFIAQKIPALKDAGLRGRLSGPFQAAGSGADPLAWEFDMDAAAEPLFVRETLRLDGFKMQVRLRNRVVNLPYLHAKPYGGSGGGRALFDLRDPKTPFNAKLYLNGVALEPALKDLKFGKDDVSGLVVFDGGLRGKLAERASWEGGGSVSVSGGKLWKTNLFKAMGDLPFVKVLGLDFVTFTRAGATFLVRGERVWTQDLRLGSETVNLILKGSVGFAGDLDMVMSIGYSDNVFAGALETGGIVPFVVEQAGALISQYKISGTLQKPKNEKLVLPAAQRRLPQ